MSLTSKLLFGFALISAIGFWLMMDQVLERVERQYLEAAEEPMVDIAHVLAEMLSRDMRADGTLDSTPMKAAMEGAKNRQFEARIYSFLKTRVDMDVYVTDAKGVVLFDSLHPETVGEKRAKRDVVLTLNGFYGARSSREDENDVNSSVMYSAAPIRVDDRVVGVVSVAKPQRSVFKFRDETRAWLKRTIGSLILCMVMGSFLLARWTTRPIRRLTDYAQAVTAGERPAVPALHGSEMKTLGGAFETMRDVLENREYVEHYVQTMTHELKSPVAAIRGAAELLQEGTMPEEQRRKFLRNIHGESLRLQDLLDRLLALAGLEKKKALDETSIVDLSVICREVCEHFEPMLVQNRLRLDHWIQDDVEVRGDTFLLHTALINLVQNAVDFSPEGGLISIGLKVVDDRACFIVEDDGPGLPDYAKKRVFERFYSLPRPHTGRKSSGLGLCFVKEAALLHRGKVELENRDGTRGARAIFSLPVR
ncbi:two-component system sensor histidine kinase CreC [Verrucomicrobium spinosum]|uniref:two-component system sensor histidine kinase CreC n=1 Tax=Verrucomicrobium spinosum TaxID=2736 RepID=UPI00049295CC|nr:two-component system sensor histidine kinase CreC [Verrucomicrobium spinosum]